MQLDYQQQDCVAEAIDPTRSTRCGWYSYDIGTNNSCVKTQLRAVYTISTGTAGSAAFAVYPSLAGMTNAPAFYQATSVDIDGKVLTWGSPTAITNTSFTNTFSLVRCRGCVVEITYIGSTLEDQGYSMAYSFMPGIQDNNLPGFLPADINRFSAMNTRRMPTPLSWVARPNSSAYYEYNDVDALTAAMSFDTMSALAVNVTGAKTLTPVLRVSMVFNLEFSSVKDLGGLLGGLVQVQDRTSGQDALITKLTDSLPLDTLTNAVGGAGKLVWNLTKSAAKILSIENLSNAAIAGGLGYASGGSSGAIAAAAASLLRSKTKSSQKKKEPKMIGYVPAPPSAAKGVADKKGLMKRR